MNAPPGVGELQVDEIQGSLFVTTPSQTGVYFFGVGIYIAKYALGQWDLMIPTSAPQGGNDFFLYQRVMTGYLPAMSSWIAPTILEVPLKLPGPVVLGGGEALHVTISNDGTSAGSFNVNAYFKSRISRIT